jgi:predicted PurR-regulated permease PerM
MEPLSFLRRVMLVALVAALALTAWRLVDLLVLMFGALVVATALRMLSTRLMARLRVPERASVPLAVLMVLGGIALAGWLVGEPLADQLSGLQERLPASVDRLLAWLHGHALGQSLLNLWEAAREDSAQWARLVGFAGLTLGALGSATLMVVAGIYMALDPQLYRRGALRLLPPAHRQAVDEALQASADGLRRWLRGQALSMVFVGTTTALGLWWLDIPLALAVGLVSGLLAFIPFVGAIGGGLLAVLLAFMEGPRAALHVAILCVAIQQVEGHIVAPLVQKWTVELPPVLGLVAAVVFGVLFGLMGVFLAAPMMVVAMILVRTLYVERHLEAPG